MLGMMDIGTPTHPILGTGEVCFYPATGKIHLLTCTNTVAGNTVCCAQVDRCGRLHSVDITDINIPAPGYDLITQIKGLDGRIEFLTEWAKDITGHMKREARTFDGREVMGVDGPRRLRVVTRAAASVRTFEYGRFQDSVERKVFNSVVRTIPPKHARTLRLAAPLPGKRSLEWNGLAAVGRAAEAAEYPGKHAWPTAQPDVLTKALFSIKQTLKSYTDDKEALRDQLLSMAELWEWGDNLLGHGDGRMILNPAKPKFELRDRDAALAQYPNYVNISRRAASESVSFVAIGSDEDD